MLEPITTVDNSVGSDTSLDIQKQKDGFGVSIKLLENGNDMKISQYFRTTSGGTIFGSYQHAKKNITLANSKKYSISHSGYGNVFLFDETIKDYYDGMAGVDISV